MGAIGGLLGTAGGMNGTGMKGPGTANIQQGTNAGDVINAQGGAANSLASQQALLSALQGQNGFGQQSAVAGQQQQLAGQLSTANGAGNQADAMQQQKAFNNNLAAANGIGTQNSAIAGLQGAAGQYQNIANGQGPNPAQAMLNQATGQNVANQAALMAGQRGAGANVGMLARQAAQQGANTQQQAVGQGAVMEANQRLNALAGLTGAQQAIGGLGSTQAGMQQAGIGAQGSLAGQQLAAQQAQQQALANQANIVAGQQIGATGANTQSQLANQQAMQNALQGLNANNISMQGNINSANAGLASKQMEGQQGMIGGLMGGIGGAAFNGSGGGAKPPPGGAAAMAAEGGDVKKMADGGNVFTPMPTPSQAMAPALPPPVAAPADNGPLSSFGQFIHGWNATNAKDEGGMGNPALRKGMAEFGKDLSGAAGRAFAAKGGLASTGGHVAAKAPDEKAVKKGNSYDNDKIDAKLSEGEIVLPRSVTMGADPIKSSAEFVRKVLAKRGKK